MNFYYLFEFTILILSLMNTNIIAKIAFKIKYKINVYNKPCPVNRDTGAFRYKTTITFAT